MSEYLTPEEVEQWLASMDREMEGHSPAAQQGGGEREGDAGGDDDDLRSVRGRRHLEQLYRLSPLPLSR